MTMTRTTLHIPVTEEWTAMFGDRLPFRRRSGRDDFVTLSEPYSEECGEPVWFYSWGNARWLRCPIGIPGDRLNDAGDRIATVDVVLRGGEWMFAVGVELGGAQ